MIDVNKITSTLAKLPDQQLQQYAQMHKHDPYIMALAMSESNRRKEMRAAGQGGQAPQEQPKVVDQMVAGMAPQQLPEEQGIGQLPAGDMNFADGGIVAFAGGGDVERYQYGGMPPRSSMMGDIPGFVAGTGNIIPQQGAPEEEPILRRWYREMNERNTAARAAEEKRRVAEGRAAPSEKMLAEAAAAKANPAQDMAQFDAATNLYMTERAAKQAAAAAPPAAPLAAPTANTGPKAPGPSVSNASLAGGLAALDPNKLYATALEKAGKEERPEKGMLEKLNAARNAAVEEELAGTKALNEKFADAFKGRRERLESREGELGTMKDQNLGLALLQAGAAMMSTPGRLGTAIGKGIQSGSQQYVAGIDKINSAKDKLADARDRLDDLQLNRDEMSAREILKAENKIRDTALSGQGDMIKYVMDRDKVDRDTAMKIVDNQIRLGITQIEQQGQNTRTGMQIQGHLDAASKDPLRMAFLAELQKTKTKENPQGDPAAAYQSIIAMKADPRSQEKLRGDWLDMAKRMQIQADCPNIKTFEDYVTVFGGGTGSAGASGGDGLRVVGVRPAK